LHVKYLLQHSFFRVPQAFIRMY